MLKKLSTGLMAFIIAFGLTFGAFAINTDSVNAAVKKPYNVTIKNVKYNKGKVTFDVKWSGSGSEYIMQYRVGGKDFDKSHKYQGCSKYVTNCKLTVKSKRQVVVRVKAKKGGKWSGWAGAIKNF